MKLAVGLGNPGKAYERTRHNVGFDVIDHVSDQLGIPLDQNKFKGVFGTHRTPKGPFTLLKPMTFMNLSGESIRQIADYYDIPPEDILVIYDDLDLPPGKIRLRTKGGHGGHNGIRSTLSHLNTESFNRIRIGIGRPEPGTKVTDHVLGRFSPDDRELVDEAVRQAAKAVEAWMDDSFILVMNDFNSKVNGP
ncbi:aminoacyl-tRNA hydrolase [Salisediminibacterium selenitireducens]|uniref:Peptidyl-tRNA hydrolase n=1 Tax=Bacillus selenitireducens (strain ATCC 700615 / DSM 15326 / MLS10) TaxID=439292 RepID=D6XV48_BACIE|nr:aminoacyl-tRNA hydrolase [Salisediminibacterium selenitireducens]ADH97606.1 peptidyl-tRNA hydrolase [[Bacillus] selenitireducens MLS10]